MGSGSLLTEHQEQRQGMGCKGMGPSQEGLGGQEGLRPLSGSWVSYEGSKPMNNRLWLSFEREH